MSLIFVGDTSNFNAISFNNIPFKIIENNKPMVEQEQEQYIKSLNDSLQDRKENPKDYILTKDDKLINELLH